ncbi:MAG: AMP-binding protein, partial [Chlamydiota bacterium]
PFSSPFFIAMKKGLENGENFIIYPSGHLKKAGYEVIGGNSFIHRLIHECPDVKIVLIRTTGLWGSCFSRAITGQVPPFWEVFLTGAKVLFKNWIFFAPRRKVLVELEVDPQDFPRQGSRLEINKYLEKWYNAYVSDKGCTVTDEPLKLVSYARNKEVYPEVTYNAEVQEKKPSIIKKIEVSSILKKTILEKLGELADINPNKIKEDQNLASDLGLDSLDVANIYTFLDLEYGVRNIQNERLATVGDVMVAAAGYFEKEEKEEKVVASGWPVEEDRPRVEKPDGKTIQEAFLRVCERLEKYSACADANSSVLTYKKMKLAALVLAQKIKDYPGDYIGIMLPSSVGTYITIFACLLAGKVPAMLNWTVGVRSLNYAAELLNLQVILSSSKFLNKVDSLDLGDLDRLIVTLEDVKHSISLKDKLKGLKLSWNKPRRLLKKLGLEKTVRESDPAVILFTSGTETYPKAVPLSHKNLLENQRAAFPCISMEKEDVFYGVLPPFHSFGFNVTGTFPVLSGMRVFYAPDPTNVKGMVKDVFNWKISIFCCAPSFFKNFFSIATPQQLKSIKLFVTGAERAPQELFDYVDSLGPNHKMIEGYGITECSPAVTIARPDRARKGVGQPLSNVELCVINPESHEVLGKNQVGEVCIYGDSVFNGYLGQGIKDPFIQIQGRRWYRSGDLGSIDDEGYLILGGRLKRFVKIGGEMVSLNALEEELMIIAKKEGWTDPSMQETSLAIGVNEKLDKPAIVLFTTFAVTRDQVNMGLRESGFGRIMKISEVKKVKEIPITGTGKVHYRQLNEWACL